MYISSAVGRGLSAAIVSENRLEVAFKDVSPTGDTKEAGKTDPKQNAHKNPELHYPG